MLPLLKLELRRQLPMVVRMACLTVVVSAVFFLAGKRGPGELLAALIGSSLGVVLIVPMGVSRDKMEGSLEFICGLPVEPSAIAASRMIAVAVLAFPWAVGVGALSLVVPATASLGPIAVAAFTWFVMTSLGACATAMLTRFELETMLGAPLVAMVIAVVLVPRAVHALLPGLTRESVVLYLQRPAAPLVLGLLVLSAVAALGIAAFRMTVSGFARYRPGADAR
jgi:hypothetical protein